MTQSQLATAARLHGLDWAHTTVSLLEAGDRRIELGEFLVLCMVLTTGPNDLLAGDGPVRIGDGLDRLDSLRQILGGIMALKGSLPKVPEGIADNEEWQPSDREKAMSIEAEQEAERKAARKLHVSPIEIVVASYARWGRSLTAERDERVGPDANHAKRGHVTRGLIAEIETHLQEGNG